MALSQAVKGLDADELRRSIDPNSLDLTPSASTTESPALIGQERATDAINLAAAVEHRDFNLFVLGPAGTGRHETVRNLLAKEASKRPIPDDWAYVNNFEEPHRPKSLRLPSGAAVRLKRAMEAMVDDLANDIPALFESDEYQTQRRAIEQEFEEQHENEMADFADRAREEKIAVLRTPMGFMLTAMRDGAPVKREEFEKLPQDEQDEINAKIERLQEDLAKALRNAPKIEKRRGQRVEELNAAMAERVVSARIGEVEALFPDQAPIRDYLSAVREDVITNAELFLLGAEKEEDGPFPAEVRKHHLHPNFSRYAVNVMVSHSQDGPGAPVENVGLPTLDQLTGRIEHLSQMGALITNFTMIKPGAFHRANGGYLVLDAQSVLSEPLAWDGLKRCLRDQQITITSLAERLSLASTTSLEPDPIPLNVRVVLIGDRLLYVLLVSLDPDFSELFKLQADFEEAIEIDDSSEKLFARLLVARAAQVGLRPLSAPAAACVMEEAIRDADDARKFSLRLDRLIDLVREAEHYAGLAGRDSIDRQDVEHAVQEKERRASRIKDRMREAVARDVIHVETSGGRVGQINGLSVVGLGAYSFGLVSRITARVRLGAGKLVDIEREVELGGPLHSKGVMILSGYLTSAYALDVPFSLHASLVFEQSYGGVEGDSASSAELYALLSALSGLPIDQGLAVTGSVSQGGAVQAIGGVNEKIEGFFDTCRLKGLTGDQGVLIPKSNVQHLMLRKDVVDAVRESKFRIIPVASVDEGISILTGAPAGSRDADGAFPESSVNARVEATLRHYAHKRRDFARMENAPGRDGGA